ncbi:hypothetical protein Tco_0439161 [Tanacetum coccineum]
MRFIPQNEVVQRYGAILPNYLTNPGMKESKVYKTYHDLATGKVQPKPKYIRRSSRTKSDEAPKPSSGKRVKATAKVAKSRKKKQPALGLETLSDIALTKAKQMKLAIERSKTQLHISQPSGSGAHEGTSVTLGVPDVPTYESDDGQISWKSSEEEDDNEENVSEIEDDDDDERSESDNNGDDFGDMINEKETHEEVEANVLYQDVNVNLEGRDTVMTDAPLPNVQETQEIEDTHVILTALINPEGIDSIFNLNTEATSLVDVPVTTIVEPPLVSATTLPSPPTHLITHMQQTLVPTPTTVPSSSLQDLPNFGSLFGFDHRLKSLETDFSEFKQTNQFTEAVSSIPNIVDAYLANKMHEAVKTAIQLQSEKLRDEAQAKNEDFLNKLDDNIKKIIKDQVKEQVKSQVSNILPKIEKTVNEQLEAKVMTRSSTESKTSLAIAANLFELELKKILIDKMESNKSIHRSDEQKNLYKVLVEAYESDKLILDTYGDTVSFKRRRDDEDKDEEPFVGSNQRSKRRRARKELESTSTPQENTPKTTGKSTEGSKSQHKSTGESAHAEEPMHTTKDLEEPAHQEFDIGATEDQSNEETSQHLDWFQKPAKLPTPYRDWNKTLPDVHGPVQPWLSDLAREEGPRESFDELTDTPLYFSAFMMNQLKVDTLTPELLSGPIFELMKGTCKSLVELEYFFEEVYKATTDQLDWNNPEGKQYPHDLRKPLPLIPNSRSRQVIPFDHFINNDLAYLSGGVSSLLVNYDKHALWGISHWGRKHQQFYGFTANRESARDVYSKRKLTNLNVEDRLAFGVSLRMFTRSIIIQRRVKDLQLGVEKYSNPRGFIYQNKDKKNKLMRIDELYKFSDGTLDDVQTALNDRLKGIRIEYLPKTIWRQSDKERAKAMIQAIEKQLKSRRIMRSLERFVGGRPYGGELQLLQRTI